jgi:hypothetical protein
MSDKNASAFYPVSLKTWLSAKRSQPADFSLSRCTRCSCRHHSRARLWTGLGFSEGRLMVPVCIRRDCIASHCADVLFRWKYPRWRFDWNLSLEKFGLGRPTSDRSATDILQLMRSKQCISP